MTTPFRVALFLAISSSILRADLTLKIRSTSGTHPPTEGTVSYQGDRMRRDFGPTYRVVDFSTGLSFTVDPAKREYFPFDGKATTRMKRVVDPASKLFNEMAYSDTGE